MSSTIPGSHPAFIQLSQLAAANLAVLISPRVNDALKPQVPALLANLTNTLPQKPSPHTQNCLEAGLYVLADDYHHAHTLCQDVPNAYGSAWHAIVHRREPDFFNSNYWWRRARNISWQLPDTSLNAHLRTLLEKSPDPTAQSWSRRFAGDTYNPEVLVDLVEHHHDTPHLAPILANLQRAEWLTLMYQTLQQP